MKEVAKLLNDMLDAGVISDYAVFGAIAQMRYTEAVSTFDADILVSVPNDEAFAILSPIYAFCAKKGYLPEGEAIRVGDWPVQFIPTFSKLTCEAIRHADCGEIDGTPLRVVRADYLAVIALSVGRAKDHARILALLECGATTREQIEALASLHELTPQWTIFINRFLDE